jgi:hypothetical protein
MPPGGLPAHACERAGKHVLASGRLAAKRGPTREWLNARGTWLVMPEGVRRAVAASEELLASGYMNRGSREQGSQP